MSHTEAAAQYDAMAQRIRAKLKELLPAVATALVPPDSQDTDWEALGATGDWSSEQSRVVGDICGQEASLIESLLRGENDVVANGAPLATESGWVFGIVSAAGEELA